MAVVIHVDGLCDISYSSALSVLHALGDKHALVLKRKDYRSGPFEWLLSPVFLKYFEEACGGSAPRGSTPRPSPGGSGDGREVAAPASSSLEVQVGRQALVVR